VSYEKVEEGVCVKITYTGTFDDGKIFDTTDDHEGEPFDFIVGSGNVVPGMDKAVLGMKKGENKKFRLEPAEAYGERDPKAIEKIPISEFEGDMKPQPGMFVQMQTNNGHVIVAEILEVNKKDVKIDLNHPLAGKSLNFDITVVDILDPAESCAGCSCGCGHNHDEEE
jgi:FKBP-type peptidyl-prolyl cis-trans isomerase 2